MAKSDVWESVKLSRPTLINGSWLDKGDSVKVAPHQKRHLVEGGYVEGNIPEDIASPGEKEQGALNVLKKPSERDDMDVWSIERVHEEFQAYTGESSQSSKSKASS